MYLIMLILILILLIFRFVLNRFTHIIGFLTERIELLPIGFFFDCFQNFVYKLGDWILISINLFNLRFYDFIQKMCKEIDEYIQFFFFLNKTRNTLTTCTNSNINLK